MKKYKLLIETAEFPKGTIVEWDQESEGYIALHNDKKLQNGKFSAFFFREQIENRLEVWESIHNDIGYCLCGSIHIGLSPIKTTGNAEKEGNEYLPFYPQEGEEYWYVDRYGDICQNKACDSCGRHNVFRAKEAAEYEKLRQQSVSNRWKPKMSERYFYCSFITNKTVPSIWCNDELDIHHYFIGNVHRTKSEAEEWGKMYGEAWRVLL